MRLEKYDSLIGKKFKRNVYGLSIGTFEVESVHYDSFRMKKDSDGNYKIKQRTPFIKSTNGIIYDLNEIVFIKLNKYTL